VPNDRSTSSTSRRKFLLGALALGGVGLVTACSGAGNSSQSQLSAAADATRTAAQAAQAQPSAAATAAPAQAPAAPTGATTIQFWSRFDFLQGAIGLYNDEAKQKGKNVFVNFTTVPGAQMVEKLTTALASKSQPDIMSLDLVQCPYFNSLGAFVDISSRVNSLAYKDEFAQGMRKLGEYPAGSGKQFQLPFSADNSALIWNKSIFQDAGLDPEKGPQTFEEFRQAAIKTTRAPDRYGMAFDGQTGGSFMFRFMPFVWANGGEYLNPEGTRSLINSPQVLQALQLWVDMIQQDKVAPQGAHTWSSDDVRGAFVGGKVAMMLNGNAQVALLNHDAPNLNYGITLIPGPTSDKHASFAGGDMLGIVAGAKLEQETWDLMQFLTSDKVQVDYLAKAGTIPIRTSFYTNPYFDKEPRYQVFTRSLEVAHAPWTLKYNRLYDSLQANLQSALAGTKTAQQALSEIEVVHNKILAS